MESLLIPIAIIVGLLIIAGLVYIGLRENNDRDPLQDRLSQYGEREIPESLEEIELSLSFQDRVLIPLLKKIASFTVRFTPQRQLEEAQKTIELAGLSGTLEPTTFFAIRIMATIGLTLLAFFLFFVITAENTAPSQAALYTAIAAALGYYYPVLAMRSKIRKRQENIVRALPDALDLLVICVDAGLGFDMAMGKVYEKWDNELAIAFGRVLREIQLGKPRREALRDMARRMDVPDVSSFTAAIIQADQLGVSIATILRVQADQMRIKRRQRAQEKAHKAPVKMMIPMVLLIFPSIWVVLMGPAAIILFESSGTTSAF